MSKWDNPIYQMYEIAKAMDKTDQARALLEAWNALEQNATLKQQYNESREEVTTLSRQCDEVEQQRDIAVEALEFADLNLNQCDADSVKVMDYIETALKQIKGE